MKLMIQALALSLFMALSASAAEYTQTFERSLKVTGNVDLEVRTDSGSITVLPGDSGVVQIRARVRANSFRLSQSEATSLVKSVVSAPPVHQTGNVIRLDEPSDREARQHVSISWEVNVPPTTSVTAHADSGAIAIRGAAGTIKATADSGSIRIENAIAPVTVTTDSGSIEVSGGAGAKAAADSGSITLRNITGEVVASTDSGSIRASMAKAAAARLSADSGSIQLELPESGGFDVDLTTDSGSVNVESQLSVTGTIRRNHVRGKIRGGGNVVNASTDSGSITVR